MKKLEDEFAIETDIEQYVTRRQFSSFRSDESRNVCRQFMDSVKSWLRQPKGL